MLVSGRVYFNDSLNIRSMFRVARDCCFGDRKHANLKFKAQELRRISGDIGLAGGAVCGAIGELVLMAEILHHLGCMKPIETQKMG